MKHIKYTLSASQKRELEAKSLTSDEYFNLSELFKKFKESSDSYEKSNLIDEIHLYIDRFSIESIVTTYFNNWSKTTTLSDSYMSLTNNLDRLCQLVYQDKYFLRLL